MGEACGGDQGEKKKFIKKKVKLIASNFYLQFPKNKAICTIKRSKKFFNFQKKKKILKFQSVYPK